MQQSSEVMNHAGYVFAHLLFAHFISRGVKVLVPVSKWILRGLNVSTRYISRILLPAYPRRPVPVLMYRSVVPYARRLSLVYGDTTFRTICEQNIPLSR